MHQDLAAGNQHEAHVLRVGKRVAVGVRWQIPGLHGADPRPGDGLDRQREVAASIGGRVRTPQFIEARERLRDHVHLGARDVLAVGVHADAFDPDVLRSVVNPRRGFAFGD